MRRALELAALADHRTSPNPMVGAVVIDSTGALAAEAWHRRAGDAHAEADALAQAGARARRGTLYVTLEPCGHHGRTPPCAEAVVAAGLIRVVVAMEDPDRRVEGRGLRLMRAAGLAVEVGLMATEAARLNEFYLHQRRTGRPFVSAKFACSLDGRIATRTGESRWITGEVARAHAHRLRHRHDGVLVGVGTVLADDPELSARFEGARQPIRVVLDSTGRTPAGARVRGERTIFDDGRDLPGLLDRLGAQGLLSLLVEGGSRVHGSFFDQRLVNRVYAYVAPVVIGGGQAPGPVAGRGAEFLAQAWKLRRLATRQLGEDVLIVADTDAGHGSAASARDAAAEPAPEEDG